MSKTIGRLWRRVRKAFKPHGGYAPERPRPARRIVHCARPPRSLPEPFLIDPPLVRPFLLAHERTQEEVVTAS